MLTRLPTFYRVLQAFAFQCQRSPISPFTPDCGRSVTVRMSDTSRTCKHGTSQLLPNHRMKLPKRGPGSPLFEAQRGRALQLMRGRYGDSRSIRMSLTPLDPDRTGTWELEGISQRDAEIAFAAFEAAQTRVEGTLVSREGRMHVTPATRAAVAERNVCALATVLIAAIAIESFLNYYGVRCFGPAFAASTIDRKPARAKAATILESRVTPAPAADSEVYQLIDRVFDRRHRIAHPKTHEHQSGVVPPAYESPVHAATASFRDVFAFFAEFARLDPGASKHFLG